MNVNFVHVFAVYPLDEEGRSHHAIIEEVYSTLHEAEFVGEAKYGEHHYTVIEHPAVVAENLEVFILRNETPLKLGDPNSFKESIKKKALLKLSALERETLQLNEGDSSNVTK